MTTDHRYTKKPVTIEAFQLTRERRFDNSDWPQWLHAAWNHEKGEPGGFWTDNGSPEKLYCGTLEGAHEVTLDDWIIRGIKGEIYPCKPDIFEATYTKAGC